MVYNHVTLLKQTKLLSYLETYAHHAATNVETACYNLANVDLA